MSKIAIPLYVRVVPKNTTWLRFIALIWPGFDRFWTTYRLPFQNWVYITYPSNYQSAPAAMQAEDVIQHELIHAAWFVRWWGPLLLLLVTVLPLPVLFSGRWFVERPAYLADIKAGRHTIDESVEILWREYGWCWPRSWMRQWFQAKSK